MLADGSTRSFRYALNIASVYLLIRGIPALLFFVLNALPPETIQALVEHHAVWLQHIFPVVPLAVPSVPGGFQNAFSLWPVLLVESLLVFLFSAAVLRRKPAAIESTGLLRWVVLIAATLIWSYAARNQLLLYMQNVTLDALQARQDEEGWMDTLPHFLVRTRATFVAVMYATVPLWALVPVWLHFRFARHERLDTTTRSNADSLAENAVGERHTLTPLSRATVFASFLLGCLALHIVLVEVIYLGLWPWTAGSLRIPVPTEVLSVMDLPMTLSQVVFSTLACVLAAYVYVRRVRAGTVSAMQLFIKPVLAGIIAYLLTCFLFLALAWPLAWLSPGAGESLLERMAEEPQSGIALAIAVNVGGLVLLCLMSGRLRESPRRWSAVLGVLILVAMIPAYVMWTLIGTSEGMVGDKPGAAITGELGDARWRNMEQWCTGVVETSHDTWLVGRTDDAGSAEDYVPEGTLDLSSLLSSNGDEAEPRGRGLFGSRSYLTTLARLGEDGKFKMVATLPDVGCLVVSPESETLFLLTGMDRPRSGDTVESGQTAVFRSVDHGKTWEWMKSGFMSETEQLAWSVQPTFVGDGSVWAWGKEPSDEDDSVNSWDEPEPVETRQAADGTELKPTALFHSVNQGETSAAVYGPAPLIAPVSYLRELTGEPEADFSGRRDMDQKRFVVQVDDKRAYAWASEFMWYRVGEESRRLMLTTRAELARSGPDGEWQITHVTRQSGASISHLRTAHDGRTFAVLQDKDGEWLAKLDPKNGEWIERHKTPALLPGWLAEDRTFTRYFWSNGDYQVVSQSGDTVVSRVLVPFLKKRAEVDTEAHFYTHDGGRSWHQLAVPGYLGVMGLSPRGSRVYWSQGNWYSENEAVQRHYDLAR